MTLRVSWLRSTVKERLQQVVRYDLGFIKTGSNERKMARNRQEFAKLFPNTFHCRVSLFVVLTRV